MSILVRRLLAPLLVLSLSACVHASREHETVFLDQRWAPVVFHPDARARGPSGKVLVPFQVFFHPLDWHHRHVVVHVHRHVPRPVVITKRHKAPLHPRRDIRHETRRRDVPGPSASRQLRLERGQISSRRLERQRRGAEPSHPRRDIRHETRRRDVPDPSASRQLRLERGQISSPRLERQRRRAEPALGPSRRFERQRRGIQRSGGEVRSERRSRSGSSPEWRQRGGGRDAGASRRSGGSRGDQERRPGRGRGG
jgi:hypothetical protein